MSDRLCCLVPFCRHTRKNIWGEGYEWICGDHWRLTERALRKRYFRARRRNNEKLQHLFWYYLKKQAIERAAGL